ncbi:hypothetical protein [Aestuariicoccus sp. MJ-SS9]|uniref:hypothetical protein n=1 Tax=Aestuariicoccus sp. MJ-SS9 TaxID=3079855 RepID=UPI002913AC22|nr:hypothetical protein [Aestuariicoccus sp. MJ-SS9]MDU8912343.1 hypothetical protein [Aestuariicoccus sp. MJ-SS9]
MTGPVFPGCKRAEVTLAAKRAFLESGAAWPGEATPECVETHGSLVFLTSDRAWKMKKPERRHFLDLSTLAARQVACQEELRLNLELAGDVYRGLTPLVAGADGALSLGGEGQIVEWLVEMRRLPENQMLDQRLQHGPPPQRAEIDGVADRMIAFYRTASHPEGAGQAFLARQCREARINSAHLTEMRHRLGAPFDAGLAESGLARMMACADEILERGAGGIIVEGHGDLRPEHVCLMTPPVIFDRLEFDQELRLADPYEEFNYLGLECEALGAGWIRDALLTRLGQSGIGPPSPALMTAYGVNRCLTRARLAIDHLRDADIRTPQKWPAQARYYLARAATLASLDEP